MSMQPGADTRLTSLATDDPAAAGRLAQIHPAFAPGAGVPAEASLADVANATGLPLDLILAAARGEIRVTVPEGAGCGCGGCGKG